MPAAIAAKPTIIHRRLSPIVTTAIVVHNASGMSMRAVRASHVKCCAVSSNAAATIAAAGRPRRHRVHPTIAMQSVAASAAGKRTAHASTSPRAFATSATSQ